MHLFRLPTRLHCTSMLLAGVWCCSLREKKRDYLSHIVTGKCSRAEEHSVCLRLMFSINGNGIVDGPTTANYPLVHFSLSLPLCLPPPTALSHLFQAPSLTRLHITATCGTTTWLSERVNQRQIVFQTRDKHKCYAFHNIHLQTFNNIHKMHIASTEM